MTMRKNLILGGVSVLMTLLFVGAVLIAQEESAPQSQPEQADAPPKIPEFYLGVQCSPPPKLLDQHLNLNGQGMLIQAIVPNSPAEKAGVRQGDILLSIDGRDIRLITDIFDVLDQTQGKELSLEVLQSGKKTELKITPENRPETLAQLGGPSTGTMRIIQPGIIFDGKDHEEARRAIRKFIEQMEQAGVNAEMIDPDQILQMPKGQSFDGIFKSGPNENVERFEVSVIEGNQPGSRRIHVRQNNEVWDVEKIEDLPKELQERVRKIVGPAKENAHEAPLGQWTDNAFDAWKTFTEKTQKEYAELESELKKAYENAPGLQEKFEKYQKATEDYMKSFWSEEKK